MFGAKTSIKSGRTYQYYIRSELIPDNHDMFDLLLFSCRLGVDFSNTGSNFYDLTGKYGIIEEEFNLLPDHLKEYFQWDSEFIDTKATVSS